MIPGMERRITEHYLCTSDVLTTASEHSSRSVQEIPLLKGSFGHTSTHTRSNPVVPNDSSEESLYGMDRAMVMSESVNSVIGLTRSASNYDGYSAHHTTIPVTAEIACPTPPPPAVPPTNGPPPMSTMASMAITSPTLTMSREELIRHSCQPASIDAPSSQYFKPKENGLGDHQATTSTMCQVSIVSMVYI